MELLNWIDRARKEREIYGELKYGKISPREDPRCFRREMVEELLDALNYCEWAREKGEISLLRWVLLRVTVKAALGLFYPCRGMNR